MKRSYIALEWGLIVWSVATGATLWTLALLGKISSWLPRCWYPVSFVLQVVHDAVTSEDGAYKSPLVYAHLTLNGLIHGGAGLAWIYPRRVPRGAGVDGVVLFHPVLRSYLRTSRRP